MVDENRKDKSIAYVRKWAEGMLLLVLLMVHTSYQELLGP